MSREPPTGKVGAAGCKPAHGKEKDGHARKCRFPAQVYGPDYARIERERAESDPQRIERCTAARKLASEMGLAQRVVDRAASFAADIPVDEAIRRAVLRETSL